jgi:selenocysteine lyase/cysteine desulfurase
MRNAVRAGLDSIEHASMSGPIGKWTFDQALADEYALEYGEPGIRVAAQVFNTDSEIQHLVAALRETREAFKE